jgi:hypothetical protein
MTPEVVVGVLPGRAPLHAARWWRTWWAHFEFTRMNTTPTSLRKEIEDLREARVEVERQVKPSVIETFDPTTSPHF